MPRPALGRVAVTTRLPEKLHNAIKQDAIDKGYSKAHGSKTRIDWQGYLGALLMLVVTEEIEVPVKKVEKGVDKDN